MILIQSSDGCDLRNNRPASTWGITTSETGCRTWLVARSDYDQCGAIVAGRWQRLSGRTSATYTSVTVKILSWQRNHRKGLLQFGQSQLEQTRDVQHLQLYYDAENNSIGRQGFVVLKVCGFHYLLRFDLCYSSVVLSIFSHKYHIQYYPHHEFSGDFPCYFSASQRTDAYQSDDVYCTAAVDSRKICVHIAY